MLPLVAADDDVIDTLMLHNPTRSREEGGQGQYDASDIAYVCECLRANTSVTHLNASFNPMGDEGARHIAGLLRNPDHPLARLSLTGCEIGSAGAQALAEALAEDKRLVVLEVDGNAIGDDGGEAFAQALSRNRKVRQLSVARNPMAVALMEKIDRQLMMR